MTDIELEALDFIRRNPGDAVGVIDNDAKFAAALVFAGLAQQGMLFAVIGENGPAYYITAKGLKASEKDRHEP